MGVIFIVGFIDRSVYVFPISSQIKEAGEELDINVRVLFTGIGPKNKTRTKFFLCDEHYQKGADIMQRAQRNVRSASKICNLSGKAKVSRCLSIDSR